MNDGKDEGQSHRCGTTARGYWPDAAATPRPGVRKSLNESSHLDLHEPACMNLRVAGAFRHPHAFAEAA